MITCARGVKSIPVTLAGRALAKRDDESTEPTVRVKNNMVLIHKGWAGKNMKVLKRVVRPSKNECQQQVSRQE